MKVTRLGKGFPALNFGYGDTYYLNAGNSTSGTVPTSNGSNGYYFGPNVATITANGSNVLTGPFVNLSAGSNIIFAVSSNTLNIASTGGGGGGPIITANGSNSLSAVVNLVAGVGIALGVSGQDITITNTGTSGGGGSGTWYTPPAITNSNSTFTAAGTSTAVTMTAPAAGATLIGIVGATGRGANSVTQTNVTWTQRYTGNGNSQWFEVWTGVVSASAGTTATFAFTGSNHQQCQTFEIPSLSPITSATSAGTNTGTVALATLAVTVTNGTYYIWGVSANQPTSSTFGTTEPFWAISGMGGQIRDGIWRANLGRFEMWSLSSSAVNWFGAVVAIS